jgi:hypothetical protein
MSISYWQAEVHSNARNKGFWEAGACRGDIPEKIALMHSELSEALEEYRKGCSPVTIYFNTDKPGKPEGIPIELADAVIRIMDFCGAYGINLEGAIQMKHAYNTTRPHKHGKVC